jgi:hypothetical protein
VSEMTNFSILSGVRVELMSSSSSSVNVKAGSTCLESDVTHKVSDEFS